MFVLSGTADCLACLFGSYQDLYCVASSLFVFRVCWKCDTTPKLRFSLTDTHLGRMFDAVENTWACSVTIPNGITPRGMDETFRFTELNMTSYSALPPCREWPRTIPSCDSMQACICTFCRTIFDEEP